MTYVIEITGDAVEEVEEGLRSTGASPAAVVSDALASRRWIRENARAGKLYIKDGSKFREVTLKK